MHPTRPGEDVEPLLLERHEVPRPDPSRPLDVGQLELLAHPRLTKAAADLEHVRLLTAVRTVSRGTRPCARA